MVRARAPRRARPATAPPSPWSFKLRIGSVFQLNQSSSVVGRIDGTTRSFQLDVHGEVNWEAGDHQVRTRLDTIEVIVKTQNTGRWVPASDFLEVESIYQYRRHPQVGPFARVSGKTSVFLGRDLRTNAVRYELPDGMLTSPCTEYRLTDRFLALTLVQSAGVFYNPVRRKQLGLAYRLAKAATLLYELRLVHQPQLIDVVQIQNNVGFKRRSTCCERAGRPVVGGPKSQTGQGNP